MFAISVTLLEKSLAVEDCHFTMVPKYPDNVRVFPVLYLLQMFKLLIVPGEVE